MKLKAIYNAVILKPYEFEEELHGNIIVPDLGNEKNKIGQVVSVGEGITVPGVGFVTTTAKIGNLSVMKSWIGVNKKGHKHINVVSDAFGILPNSWSNTALFVRVNSVKNFTALYGGAGTYGNLYGEEMISTLAIGGFMYKGKLAKSLDATIIAACVYSPYTKYYTESLFESKPIVIPFFNFNYKLTKTFGFGLTGGGTYVASQSILNYQILMGAKLLL